MFAIIPHVNSADYAILESDPPIYVISANGTVPTSGWSNPLLSPYVYVRPPEDGIQDFSFVAVPPTGIVNPVEQTICVHWEGYLPDWVKGFRIHSAGNSIEISLEESAEKHTARSLVDRKTPGGEVPWPITQLGGEIPWPLKIAGGEIPWPLLA